MPSGRCQPQSKPRSKSPPKKISRSYGAVVNRNWMSGLLKNTSGNGIGGGRLVGVNTSRVKLAVLAGSGVLTGLAALLNSVRFDQIPTNAGLGLEMRVIAAVVIGGTAITGGRGTILGTLLGVLLMGAVGPGLTFLGVSAYWERAIQGAIILTAVLLDATSERTVLHSHGATAAA